MRVLFSKFHCPSFICFCKPSPHLLSPRPLKLENTPHVPSTLPSVPETVAHLSEEKGDEIEKEECLDGGDHQEETQNFPKSSLRKPSSELGSGKDVVKRKVQWMDFLGKELAEIKEFEMSESGESDDEGDISRSCVCVIQ